MDLLHKRYASPFSLFDNLIHAEQFGEWIEHFLNGIAKEKDDAMMWEYFLHKVHDKSFNEWKSELSGNSNKSGVMEEAKKKDIILSSSNILNRFNPEPKEVNR